MTIGPIALTYGETFIAIGESRPERRDAPLDGAAGRRARNIDGQPMTSTSRNPSPRR